MPRFFLNPSARQDLSGGAVSISGDDAAHITRVLRMKPGDRLTVCDGLGSDLLCEIAGFDNDAVLLHILDKQRSQSEPDVAVTLYQGLPKGDKMELIVQKCVELGVTAIVPVLTLRSVSRPDGKTLAKKNERWNRIAAEAAKQCGRGILPQVLPTVDFKAAVGMLKTQSAALMLYEQNGGTLRDYFDRLAAIPSEIGVLVGPEGGFDPEEVGEARNAGIPTAGMGPRILRTETAPLCALSVIMYATGNL
jgi:16S rRNA (uracil1498-N3)-methyltransferase